MPDPEKPEAVTLYSGTDPYAEPEPDLHQILNEIPRY